MTDPANTEQNYKSFADCVEQHTVAGLQEGATLRAELKGTDDVELRIDFDNDGVDELGHRHRLIHGERNNATLTGTFDAEGNRAATAMVNDIVVQAPNTSAEVPEAIRADHEAQVATSQYCAAKPFTP